ncbi:MAG TPA: hypothetical protein IGS17_06525 [Oscillatoriales cyanobacterium M59_W2019_021]|nr:MAG: hypothetical protein D6728_07320 [Cyanobacteria bacterium J055]HIK31572.1 hypothetical protein [Oscillatoriales cyanobacterium M4454_W2019_049]HIK50568.1 hypothetical protein [Oscillatoriales cyanobacterium M59_W2019_021]
MTPTLLGRWQTRILLLTLVGFPITLPFTIGAIGPGASPIFGLTLLYVILFGLLWDVVYDFLQQFRWDRDWPGALQLLAGMGEAVFLGAIAKSIPLPGLLTEDLSLRWFAIHYTCVWLGVYVASQSLTRILFPRWRFRGGKWLG